MPTRTELNDLYSAAHQLKQVTKERDELHIKLIETLEQLFQMQPEKAIAAEGEQA